LTGLFCTCKALFGARVAGALHGCGPVPYSCGCRPLSVECLRPSAWGIARSVVVTRRGGSRSAGVRSTVAVQRLGKHLRPRATDEWDRWWTVWLVAMPGSQTHVLPPCGRSRRAPHHRTSTQWIAEGPSSARRSDRLRLFERNCHTSAHQNVGLLPTIDLTFQRFRPRASGLLRQARTPVMQGCFAAFRPQVPRETVCVLARRIGRGRRTDSERPP
jgi:hypothetical protein